VSRVRYRIARPLPRRLDYPKACYALEIVRQRHDTIPVDEWVLQARKLGVGTVCLLASTLAFRNRLLDTLEHGFEVEAGTPAARIMARLVSDGVAVELRSERR